MLAISDALDRFVRSRGWEERLRQEIAVRAWPRIVGPELARHTVGVAVRAGVLHVAVQGGIWATQMTFFRTELLRRLRAEGAAGIRDLAFHVGDPPDGIVREVPDRPPPLAGPAQGPTPAERAEAVALTAQAGDNLPAQAFGSLYLAAMARRKRLDTQLPPS